MISRLVVVEMHMQSTHFFKVKHIYFFLLLLPCVLRFLECKFMISLMFKLILLACLIRALFLHTFLLCVDNILQNEDSIYHALLSKQGQLVSVGGSRDIVHCLYFEYEDGLD